VAPILVEATPVAPIPAVATGAVTPVGVSCGGYPVVHTLRHLSRWQLPWWWVSRRTYPGNDPVPDDPLAEGRDARFPMLELSLTIRQTEKAIQVTRNSRMRKASIRSSRPFAGGQSSNPDSTGRQKYVSRSTLSKDKLLNLGTISSGDLGASWGRTS